MTSFSIADEILWNKHYGDVIMDTIASQITSLTIVYSIVYSGTDQIKHQSSASLAFVRGIHRGPVNSPHKGPVTRKMFPFDDVIMAALHVLKQLLLTWMIGYCVVDILHGIDMVTSSHGNALYITGLLRGESPVTGNVMQVHIKLNHMIYGS